MERLESKEENKLEEEYMKLGNTRNNYYSHGTMIGFGKNID